MSKNNDDITSLLQKMFEEELDKMDKIIMERIDWLEKTKKNDVSGYSEYFSENVEKILSCTEIIEPLNIGEYEISREEMINLALDFYKSLSLKYYEHAKQIINSEKNYTFKIKNEENPSLKYGYTRYDYAQNKVIVSIPEEYTLNNALTLVHELGHTMDAVDFDEDDKIRIYNFMCRSAYSETTAVIFEKIFLEYLWNKTDYPKEAILKVMIDRHNYLVGQGNFHAIDDSLLTLKELDFPVSARSILAILNCSESKADFGHAIKKLEDYINRASDSYVENMNYATALLNSEIVLIDYQKRGVEAIENYLTAMKNHTKESFLFNFIIFPTEDIMKMELNKIYNKLNEVNKDKQKIKELPVDIENINGMFSMTPSLFEDAFSIDRFLEEPTQK